MKKESSPSNEHRFAVAYYRHSAEDKQENSIEIQRELTKKYANKHGIVILHEEVDEGKTGLLASRPGFQSLFQDWICNEQRKEFKYVLVYDVSRWGRFQDQDEAAYYEFLCKQRGKRVVYVNRGIPAAENELLSTLQTSIERYMAAEYSRQLSVKVFHGSVKVSEQGFSAGGPAPYGFQRVLVDRDGGMIRVLKRGEHKLLSNQRVTYAPVGDQSTKIVKVMFYLFVKKRYSPRQIALFLNKKMIPPPIGSTWSGSTIRRILKNETYIGTKTYNKTSNKLKSGRVQNDSSLWIRCENAFDPIVPKGVFNKAQNLIARKPARLRRVKSQIRSRIQAALLQTGMTKGEAFLRSKYAPLVTSLQRLKINGYWCFNCPQDRMRLRSTTVRIHAVLYQHERS